MLRRVEFDGEERARLAYAQGKGVLFVTGHFGFWELHAMVHPLRFEPIGVHLAITIAVLAVLQAELLVRLALPKPKIGSYAAHVPHDLAGVDADLAGFLARRS